MTTEIGSQEGIGTGIEIKVRLVVNRQGTLMIDLLQGQYRHFLNIPRAVKSFGLAILRTGLPNSPPLGFSIQFNPIFQNYIMGCKMKRSALKQLILHLSVLISTCEGTYNPLFFLGVLAGVRRVEPKTG